MRLYLSSFRMGSCPQHLVGLTRDGRRAAVVANAADAYPADARSEAVDREVQGLRELGFVAEELDLRNHFDDSAVEGILRNFDLIWVRGGDVHTLRYTLARSGADDALVALLADDALAYGGYSAGTCVLAPTLRGLEMVDDPGWLNHLYGADPIWAGLGVLDYCVVPHVDSPDHPESEACDRLAGHYRSTGVPFKPLRDGQVIVVDGETTTECS